MKVKNLSIIAFNVLTLVIVLFVVFLQSDPRRQVKHYKLLLRIRATENKHRSFLSISYWTRQTLKIEKWENQVCFQLNLFASRKVSITITAGALRNTLIAETCFFEFRCARIAS